MNLSAALLDIQQTMERRRQEVEEKFDSHEGWPQFAMQTAIRAAGGSPDPSTKNGAVLRCFDPKNAVAAVCVDCNRFSVLGQGTPVAGSVSIAELLANRDKKLQWVEHAERNVIFTAIRAGYDLRGASMYCPFAACTDCARAIVLCGVKRLVRLPKSVLPWPETWAASIAEADRIMEAGGVKVEDYPVSNGEPFGLTVLVNKVEYNV